MFSRKIAQNYERGDSRSLKMDSDNLELLKDEELPRVKLHKEPNLYIISLTTNSGEDQDIMSHEDSEGPWKFNEAFIIAEKLAASADDIAILSICRDNDGEVVSSLSPSGDWHFFVPEEELFYEAETVVSKYPKEMQKDETIVDSLTKDPSTASMMPYDETRLKEYNYDEYIGPPWGDPRPPLTQETYENQNLNAGDRRIKFQDALKEKWDARTDEASQRFLDKRYPPDELSSNHRKEVPYGADIEDFEDNEDNLNVFSSLTNFATFLDKKGLTKEADYIDRLIAKNKKSV